MGIEDLSRDLAEQADHVLLVTADENTAKTIGKLLDVRSYQWTHRTDRALGSEVARREIIDALIYEHSDPNTPPSKIIDDFRSDALFSRVPLVLLHPEPNKHEEDVSIPGGSQVSVLKTPVEPSQLLVKLTTVLRLRKLKKDELRLDAKIAEQNAQLRDLTNRFKRELKEAKSIQQSILPKTLPKHQSCKIAAQYIPLEAVGGDLYDIWQIDDERIGFFIGDVTGHGLPAAFIGAMTKMALSYASKDSPEKMLFDMNAGINDHMPEGRFVTVAAAIYHPATGLLQVARGGHPPSYLWRAKKNKVEQIKPRGMALGMVPEARYELFQTDMEPGDKLLFITDGIVETTDMSGEMIGLEGVARFFSEASSQFEIEQCLEYVVKQQNIFSSGRILKDDDTLIGLQRVS